MSLADLLTAGEWHGAEFDATVETAGEAAIGELLNSTLAQSATEGT